MARPYARVTIQPPRLEDAVNCRLNCFRIHLRHIAHANSMSHCAWVGNMIGTVSTNIEANTDIRIALGQA